MIVRLTMHATVATLLVARSMFAQVAAPHPYRPGVDVVHYDFALDLPDRGDVISGRAVISVRRTAAVDTLTLDLLALRVDTVMVNGASVAFRRDSGTISVPLGRGTDSVQVTVVYGGSAKDGLIITSDSSGRWTAFGDNWPNRARYWLPTVDHPSDKASVSWSVRSPSTRRVVANGELVEETPIPVGNNAMPRTLTRWREARPIATYLMVIAAAPLARYELGREGCGVGEFDQCVPQSVYVAPEVRDFLPGPFRDAPGIVKLFGQLVAPFPYEKLAHLESSTRYGGMENASAIFYADNVFRQRTMQVGLIAHETAHQWFGDAVTEREWPHVWLSEGFASYFAELWTEHALGDSAFRAAMARIRGQIVASPVTAQRPVIDTAQTDLLKLLNTNSYQKGAFTLHMMRDLVGDSAFFRGVRAYYLKYRHSTALSDDLRREVETTSGKELGWFFDQWLRRPGFAELKTEWRYDAGARRVVVTVTQGARFAPYRFPLELQITDAAGRPHTARVDVPATHLTTVTVPLALDAAPRAVAFDPRVRLLATFSGQ
jgi:aminopeptidase N